MTIQKIIQESINSNPLEMKEALAEELRLRIGIALEAKINEAVELDEISYRDSGAQNMMRASRKADKEADKVRAQAAKAAAKEAAKKKPVQEETDLSEADKPMHQYYATTQYINRSEIKMLHDKKKPFATEKEAFEHIKSRGGRQDGTIHKVNTANGKIVSLRHVAGGQAGYVSDVGAGDPKNVSELTK
jgi:hypothetical protein